MKTKTLTETLGSAKTEVDQESEILVRWGNNVGNISSVVVGDGIVTIYVEGLKKASLWKRVFG